MNKMLRLLNPLLALTFGVGLGKFFWAVIGEPHMIIALHNLTALQFIGALILTFRVAAQPDLGIRHLWLGNHLLFAYCQGLFLLGSLHAPLAGASLIYFQSESIQYLMGDSPPATFQPGARLLNWVIIAPIVVTWISGAPVLLLRRLQGEQEGWEDDLQSPAEPAAGPDSEAAPRSPSQGQTPGSGGGEDRRRAGGDGSPPSPAAGADRGNP